jgi:hypothetical protein
MSGGAMISVSRIKVDIKIQPRTKTHKHKKLYNFISCSFVLVHG